MKGLFTQGFAILTNRFVPIEELRELLPEYPFLKTDEDSTQWEFSGPCATIAYRPEVNGYIVIDSVDRPWPDHMGNSKDEFTLLGAWSMGHFGPLAFPQNLSRATEQARLFPDAKTVVPLHNSFLRIRLSYTFGAEPDALCIPADCKPLHEVGFLTDLMRGILGHSAAICYFNPNGEVLLPAAAVETAITYHTTHDIPPLLLWSNVRLFYVNDDWLTMDTVGNGQLDMRDHEAVFPKARFDPNEIVGFLRNASLYILNSGDVIKPGHTMDGPGNIRWRASIIAEGISSPPREVMRWVPFDIHVLPAELQRNAPTSTAASTTTEPSKPWWRRVIGR